MHARHFSKGKLKWSLLPISVLEEVIKVLMWGARKYGDNNWMRGTEWSEYYNSGQRHRAAFWSGEDKDSESKLYHLSHSIVDDMFLLWYTIFKVGRDDRPK